MVDAKGKQDWAYILEDLGGTIMIFLAKTISANYGRGLIFSVRRFIDQIHQPFR